MRAGHSSAGWALWKTHPRASPGLKACVTPLIFKRSFDTPFLLSTLPEMHSFSSCLHCTVSRPCTADTEGQGTDSRDWRALEGL